MACSKFLGLPQCLGTNELRNLVSASRVLMSDESSFPKLTSMACPDPAGPSPLMSVSSTATPPQPVLDDADVAGLRRKFQFLKDFSDDFIRKTPLEVLLKTETTAIKIKEFERNKAVGDKLASNREYLSDTFYAVAQGEDNRWDKIHEARFLPGACCSASSMWLRAREVIGLTSQEPVGTYDMASIGLGGFVSKRGWVELHNVASDSISLRMFNINGCGTKISGKGLENTDEFKEVTEFGEFKLALRVAKEAQAFVHPWNKSLAALEGFMYQTDFCKQDLSAVEKPAQVLTQFCDYVMGVNADRWRGCQPFVSTGELKGVWDSFWGAKPESKLKQKPAGSKQKSKFVFDSGYFDDICRLYNMGRCLKPNGTCSTRAGVPLRHICNYKQNPAKPLEVCGKTHMAIFFHPPPTHSTGN
jgi:hypothetical protein